MLLQAVTIAGLAGALDDAMADLTVFAPTDGAFIATAQALGYAGGDEAGAFDYLVTALSLLSQGGDPVPLLKDILSYHVSPGAKDANAVTSATSLSTILGTDVGVNGTELVDLDPDLPKPTITATNIVASNGIVHAIDGVLIPADLLPSDGSNDVDFIIGDTTSEVFDLSDDNDFVDASAGDDTITPGDGDDVVVGGLGTDTAILSGDLDDYGLSISASGVTVSDKGGAGSGTDFLVETELLQFGDGASFLAEGAVNLASLSGVTDLSEADINTLVELYVAYFNRAPDAFGLLFWSNALNEGVSINKIAELFFDQPEAQAKIPGDTENAAFVDLAYNHLLERDPDDAGRAFWVRQLDEGNVDRAEFMLELIAGARSNTSATDDVRTVEDKADIGIAYALIAGLTNADNAQTVLDAYDRDDADDSLATAQNLIEGFIAEANGANGTTEVTVQVVGVVDDPFLIA